MNVIRLLEDQAVKAIKCSDYLVVQMIKLKDCLKITSLKCLS